LSDTPKKPRPPPTPKQLAASRRNWALMLLLGARGHLAYARRELCFDDAENAADLCAAIDALDRIDKRRKSGLL
jgi:hypothetical protein